MTLDEAYTLYRSVRDSGQPTVECIEKLYPLVRERVTRVIGKVLRRTPSEDLIVTCTTDVLMDIDQYDPSKSFSTWIESITRHVCYREKGKKGVKTDLPDAQFQPYAFDKQLDGGISHDPPDIGPDPSMLDLSDEIASLAPYERRLVDLLFAGYTYKEISESYGIPVGTVKSRVHEIKNKMRPNR